jgi:NAD(P)-dependent dehydrogenase (short-subunit alcohol dehydrogenase family)
MTGLDGRMALVTGAASGIGRAIAQAAGARGAAVAVSDIQDEAGEAVAAEIREAGGTATYLHHDVVEEHAWIAAVERTVEELGRLDVLVNNAGVGDLSTIEETSLEDYERTIGITQTSVFLEMKHAAAALNRLPAARLAHAVRDPGVEAGAILDVNGGQVRGAVPSRRVMRERLPIVCEAFPHHPRCEENASY